jgi:hypothetical protein
MDFEIQYRSASIDEAKDQLQIEFGEVEANATHPIDWQTVEGCAHLALDVLQADQALDVVVSIKGQLAFEGDIVRNVKLSLDCLLTDRIG